MSARYSKVGFQALVAVACVVVGPWAAACNTSTPSSGITDSASPGMNGAGSTNAAQSPSASGTAASGSTADGSAVFVGMDASTAPADANNASMADASDAGTDSGPWCNVASCAAGTCGEITCLLPTSCKDLLASATSIADGVYTLDPDGMGGADPFLAYCDMTNDGGGWTLALKADGNNQTFTFTAPAWTDGSIVNADKPAFDTNEAKLQTWNTIAFDDIRVGMTDPRDTTTRYVKLNLPGSASLYAVFSPGTPISTSLGRASWEGLLSTGSLQSNCNLEGINTDPSNGDLAKVRIGFVGNQENDCGSPDSWIGIGGSYPIADCAAPTNPSVGNTAPPVCGPYDHGSQQITAFGYVLVR